MKLKRIFCPLIALAFFAGILSSCDTTSSGTNPDQGSGNVKLQFKTVNGSHSKALSTDYTASDHDSVIVDGSNGSLQLDDIRFIVGKFKFEYEDDGCAEADTSEGPDCEEFEAEPFFVDLPLNEDTLSLANDEIGAGLYKKIEFEVKDLDFENEEEGEEQEHQALADSIRSEFPEWPDEASMIITGTFTPTDGDPHPFKIFAKAEIEIEHEFEPPLEVTDDNMQKVVSVNINPARWLQQEDGTVINLGKYDWDEHGELLEFSAKFKDSIEEIRVDEEELEDGDDD
ncbi:hypothetical protein NC796_00355 [Aliifodinibius sp. S!AR15-10]|uniref:hypothetical protein n=1 Tax=Aliifodinibius sp. S!AR15-10 TaxID=2950437 RepID=UPI002861CD74|nr:hypothetical protein [Aliifodinibius sp. S!AR15-10]MDR8389564.1 hypothetical protein [Aliifodinibius sp. S!AR15-10]